MANSDKLPESIASEIFFPRPDMPYGSPADGAFDHMFDAGGVTLRIRVFPGPADAPSLLFFHGNGETARDYDFSARYFNEIPCTLLAAEYRGYGPCSGDPSMNTFLEDAHRTMDEARELVARQGLGGRMAVMGRSLGSAPAIELAHSRSSLGALVVESGFSLSLPLLHLIGVSGEVLGITEAQGPRNLEKMKSVSVPTLIIHAEQDELLPIRNGEELRDAAGGDVEFLRVPGAGHNDVQIKAGDTYFEAIRALLEKADW